MSRLGAAGTNGSRHRLHGYATPYEGSREERLQPPAAGWTRDSLLTPERANARLASCRLLHASGGSIADRPLAPLSRSVSADRPRARTGESPPVRSGPRD